MSRAARWNRPDRRTVFRLILLPLAAVVAGIAQFASYQPTGLWWAAPLGLGVLFATVDHISTRTDRPVRWIMWLTWIQGLTCYLFLLPWVGKYVGAIAWLGLSLLESLYCLALGAGLAFLLRKWPRHPLLLLAVPAWYVAVE
ncbi:MAG: apolipoprotein N-acyltransferase, partial [Corynebacterium variabile]